VPALDALRGVAILAVFAQHLSDRFEPWARAGIEGALPAWLAPWALTLIHHAWWGVDLFFVVSGMSLGLGYVRAYGTPGRPPPRAVAFWKRRAARLLPAYAVALVVTIAAHHRVVSNASFAASLAAHAALLQGYIAPGGIILIGATWSLTTEGHFYLLLPLFARPLLTPSRPARAILVGAALCATAWFVRGALHALVLEPGVRTFMLELTQRRLAICRLDEFVLGALCALAYDAIDRKGLADRAARIARPALFAAIAALVVALRLDGIHYFAPGGAWPYALVSLATAAIVLVTCLQTRPAESSSRLEAPSLLARLGVVSYGVFLYHELLLGVTGAVVPLARGPANASTFVWTASLALAASVLAGYASWRLIELPMLRLAAGKRDRRTDPAAEPAFPRKAHLS
jgi:peptidoglycan/LPS O-acetylase OafA/YrhL